MSAKRLLTTFILALVISATAASAASARPIDAVGATPAISGPSTYVGDEATVSHTGGSTPGFDWADAGIGAAAAFAVMMVGLGRVLVLNSRRQRRPERPAAV